MYSAYQNGVCLTYVQSLGTTKGNFTMTIIVEFFLKKNFEDTFEKKKQKLISNNKITSRNK